MKTNVLIIFLHAFLFAGAAGVSADGESRAKRSDDAGLGALETLVQQQATAIQTLETRLTAVENTMPSSFKPVAFTVRFSSRGDVILGQHSTLQFDAVVTNIGNGYNPQTGIFTAPVSGLYFFLLTPMSSNGRGSVVVELTEGGRTVLGQVWGDGSTDPNDQESTHATCHLSAGEQVWARQAQGEALQSSYWTIFTGYLVQAD